MQRQATNEKRKAKSGAEFISPARMAWMGSVWRRQHGSYICHGVQLLWSVERQLEDMRRWNGDEEVLAHVGQSEVVAAARRRRHVGYLVL